MIYFKNKYCIIFYVLNCVDIKKNCINNFECILEYYNDIF